MKKQDRGNFWVIDGHKVKKNKPFCVSKIQRLIQPKEQEPVEPVEQNLSTHQGQEQMVRSETQKYFFQEGYESMKSDKIDFGNLKLSSVSSLIGQKNLFSNEGENGSNSYLFSNFAIYNDVRCAKKKSIFINEFQQFEYENGYQIEEQIYQIQILREKQDQ